MREPLPFESVAAVEREDRRGVRIDAVRRELLDMLDTRGRALLAELLGLYGEQQAAGEDHVLRVAGHLCQQFEAPELWTRIFTTALYESAVAPGDELAFLACEWAL